MVQLKYAKAVLQIIATIVFTTQMIFAVQKYVANPSMILTDSLDLSALDRQEARCILADFVWSSKSPFA